MKKENIKSILVYLLTGVVCGIVGTLFSKGVSLVTNIPVGFLTFDAKDAVITIASFIYGPTSAVIMSLLTFSS